MLAAGGLVVAVCAVGAAAGAVVVVATAPGVLGAVVAVVLVVVTVLFDFSLAALGVELHAAARSATATSETTRVDPRWDTDPPQVATTLVLGSTGNRASVHGLSSRGADRTGRRSPPAYPIQLNTSIS